MKHLKFWIGGVVAMLAVSGVALAGGGASTATPSATFTASAKRVETRNCQGGDGKYTITRGRYEGTFVSTTPGLNGPARLTVRSVYNNDESAGWITGELQVRNGTVDGRTQAKFSAVNLDGNVEGLIVGKSGPPRANLLANFSATFDQSSSGGFTDGKLGSGASGNEALLFGGGCTSDKPDKAPKNDSDTKPTDQTNQNAPKDGGRHK
jgi:hypothetical protein